MVIILRGAPGSGKSTWANANYVKYGGVQTQALLDFAKGRPLAQIFSADDYFMKDGAYIFDRAKIGEAHQSCQKKFLYAAQMYADEEIIIVDNTNTAIWEFGFYVVAAQLHGHKVQIITFVCDPREAWERNQHEVPPEVVLGLNARLHEETPRIPSFWPQKVIFTHKVSLGL